MRVHKLQGREDLFIVLRVSDVLIYRVISCWCVVDKRVIMLYASE